MQEGNQGRRPSTTEATSDSRRVNLPRGVVRRSIFRRKISAHRGESVAIISLAVISILVVPIPWISIGTERVTALASPPGTPLTLDGNLSTNLSAASNSSALMSGPLTPSVPAAFGSWPTYEFARNRSGYNLAENTLARANSSNIQLEWNVTLPGPVVASPTEVNGTVYVGSWDGYEYALNAMNGSQRWSTFLGVENFSGHTYGATWLSPLGVSSSAAVVGTVVYVGAFHNYYALNSSTGAIIWNQTITNDSNPVVDGYYSWSSPTVYRGNVYVGVSSQIDNPLVVGGVNMYDATTGAWKAHWYSYGGTLGGSIWSTPTIDATNNTLWVTTGNGGGQQNSYSAESVVALNASTLAFQGQWTVTAQSGQTLPNDVDFGAGVTLFTAHYSAHYVVATNKDGYAYALNGTKLSSKLAWYDQTTTFPGASTCQPPGQAISPGVWDGSSLYLGSSYTTVGGVHVNGSVRAVYPGNGTYRWQATAPGTVLGGLAAADGLVAASSRWFYTTPSGTCYNYHGTNDSWLQVFNSTNGHQLYRFFIGYPVVGAPTIADGRIFVGATLNSTTNWNTIQNHFGHVYAFGLTLAAPTHISIFFAIALNGTVGMNGWGNASGGMPAYGSLLWAWGDSTSTPGHFGSHNYGNTPKSFIAGFSLIDATGATAASYYRVVVGYQANCAMPAQFCTTIDVIPCGNLLACLNWQFTIPVTVYFAGGVKGFTGGLTYDWNFGDGSQHSSQATPAHSYAQHATYSVTMTVTDLDHHQAVDTFQVTV